MTKKKAKKRARPPLRALEDTLAWQLSCLRSEIETASRGQRFICSEARDAFLSCESQLAILGGRVDSLAGAVRNGSYQIFDAVHRVARALERPSLSKRLIGRLRNWWFFRSINKKRDAQISAAKKAADAMPSSPAWGAPWKE
jgi:hypothetical protein